MFGAITGRARAGMPVDAVTVRWEAGRRGARVEPHALGGGFGVFARTNLTQVYRRAVLARAWRAGVDVQAGAADPALTIGGLLADAAGRLAAAEGELAAERCELPERAVPVVALRSAEAKAVAAARPDAEHGLEAAL